MRRWLRILKHRWLIFIGKDITIYPDADIPGILPNKYISNKAFDNDIMIYNVGYNKDRGGYVIIASPMKRREQ